MTRSEIENVTPEIEMLARMWIECDPNRSVEPDEMATLVVEGSEESHPRWMWFIPRAQASLAFMQTAGYVPAARPVPPHTEG